ncbi:hypothetical protein BO221_09910 [Archangium sp. Cb G35]|uniref:hypothetical protein n=1 Tax=Archangium sp. Cb G35 TaxID=1920190 RepID=UPI000937F4D7|nr:hypothetical protein [Archangium sp. Cb G35]OJT26127.1 hypothetical protein BO221_09910 [Archangium sp. Cb G35]
MSYDLIEFPFQVHSDAKVVERAYLVPEGLPWGATLEVTPSQADIPPGETAIFTCRLTLDNDIIRPGCTNDQGFSLTAWRIAEDADERWGSCFYFIRPRVRTRLRIMKAQWHEKRLLVFGVLSLDTDQSVDLNAQLPLSVRVRLEHDHPAGNLRQWVTAPVQPGGAFSITREEFNGPPGVELRIQAWFDRTDLLASSRSDVFRCPHITVPVIG